MIPLLSKPGFLSFRNRIIRSDNPAKESIRVLGIILLGLIISWAGYSGTLSTLSSLQEYQHLYYIPPTRLLEILLFFLFGITTLTSGISFLGVFLLSNDLELLRSSPISPYQFFIGKFSELAGFSSWIVLFFGLPVMFAYGTFFHHPFLFYFSLVLLFPLFLILATTIGSLCVLLFSAIIPAYKVRDIILIFALVMITGGYIWFRHSSHIASDAETVRDIVRLSVISSSSLMAWVPSTWFSAYFSHVLVADSLIMGIYPYLILGATGLTLSIFYLTLRFGFERLYINAHSSRRGQYRDLLEGVPVLQTGRRLLPRVRLGMMVKEVRLFLRDVTQTIQFMLLLTLALIYLYNFKGFQGLYAITGNGVYIWQGLFSLANILMGGFILIAMSARFAYPSISLEGQAWWILQTAPIPTKQILREKVLFWWILLALPIAVIFFAGSLALNLPPTLIVGQAFLSLSLCHVFLAFGMSYGAYFASFDWEHPAQLTSNMGSFAFMVSGTFLLFFLMIPISLCTLLYVISQTQAGGYSSYYGVASLTFLSLIIVWNARFAERKIADAAKTLDNLLR